MQFSTESVHKNGFNQHSQIIPIYCNEIMQVLSICAVYMALGWHFLKNGLHNTVECRYKAAQDITLMIIEIEAEYQPEAGTTKDFVLTGELWGVFC